MKIKEFLKKELMLTVSVVAAVVSLFITPPTAELLYDINWHTLGMLFMMLTVLEGFKQENLFRPLILLCTNFKTMTALSLFFIFGVFFTSMFVTNDVALIIFVPLTILLFKKGDKEKYILPVITMENIAAIRGSLLTPFGSPQNLFFYTRTGYEPLDFLLMMAPICIMSAVLLIVFVFVLYRKDVKEKIEIEGTKAAGEWTPEGKVKRIAYPILFLLVVITIVSRTELWPASVAIVIITVFFVNKKLFKQVDYVLLITFLCFFIFSSSISSNPHISGILKNLVAGHEYVSCIALSQIISNVPSTIVLYPFTENYKALIYGADTAGLVSLIGSLASVINYRIYVREYPGNGRKFIKVFTLISWAFFIIVVLPGYFLSK